MKVRRILIATLASISLPRACFARKDIAYSDSADLTNFVTHPEIKVPILNVSIHDFRKQTRGFWFMAPFHRTQEPLVASSSYYVPCQAGPAIYDAVGNLIWSGACVVQNNNTFDFRLTRIGEKPYLSWIRQKNPRNSGQHLGIGELFDLSYQNQTNIQTTNITVFSNFHEFNHIKSGWNTLVITESVKYADLHEIGLPYASYPVLATGFQEIHSKTGQVIFEWDPLSHVSIAETSILPEDPKLDPDESNPFDFMHMNSVDKNVDGDYLVSARHTDTIYKISGRDGRVVWRLGGKTSDFVLQGFNFTKQHDARFLQSNHTHTTISFLNNAASKFLQSASHSSALVVSLDTATTPMTARVISQYDRPDKGLTRRMGNIQTLPGGGRLVNWSQGGYITEYSPDGDMVLEARYVSNRFGSYRAYKHDFTGTPAYPPRLKAIAYGVKGSEVTTACYVSWNGATEVASWKFYAREETMNVSLGAVPRRGFETEFMFRGYQKHVTVEALNANGAVLGLSDIKTVRPSSWTAQDIPAGQSVEKTNQWLVVFYFILAIVIGFLTGIAAASRWLWQPRGYKNLGQVNDLEEFEPVVSSDL